MDLVGPAFKEFRQKLMTEKSPKNLAELRKKITPPKGVHRKSRIEGMELFDCNGDEIQSDIEEEDVEEEVDEIRMEQDREEEEGTKVEPKSKLATLSNLSTNQDINSDAKFLDELQLLLEKHETSKLSIPFMSQI